MVGYGQNKFVLVPLLFLAYMMLFFKMNFTGYYYLKVILTGSSFEILLDMSIIFWLGASCYKLLYILLIKIIYYKIKNLYNFNRGIVPITCDEMFKTMDKNADPNKVGIN